MAKQNGKRDFSKFEEAIAKKEGGGRDFSRFEDALKKKVPTAGSVESQDLSQDAQGGTLTEELAGSTSELAPSTSESQGSGIDAAMAQIPDWMKPKQAQEAAPQVLVQQTQQPIVPVSELGETLPPVIEGTPPEQPQVITPVGSTPIIDSPLIKPAINTPEDLMREYSAKAVNIRPFVRENNPEDPSDVSTVKMATETFDEGKTWQSFPTIFPKDPSKPSTDPKDWIDLGDDPEAAFKEAKKRDEVFNFGENSQLAINFGKGSWKNLLKSGPTRTEAQAEMGTTPWQGREAAQLELDAQDKAIREAAFRKKEIYLTKVDGRRYRPRDWRVN